MHLNPIPTIQKMAAVVAAVLCTQTACMAEEPKPVKALLVIGGCCHDYDNQKEILPANIDTGTKLDVDWTIIDSNGKADTATFSEFYGNPEWAEGYDIVIHNECYVKLGERAFTDSVLKPHKEGLPAMMIHCAMHTFRADKEAHVDWQKFCGVATRRHGPKHPFTVEILEPEHEVMAGMEDWTTPQGELYFIDEVFPGVTPLAHSKSNKTGEMHVNIWAHEYGPNNARVFGTTIGHHNETMLQEEYMQLMARGFLWALEKPVSENLR